LRLCGQLGLGEEIMIVFYIFLAVFFIAIVITWILLSPFSAIMILVFGASILLVKVILKDLDKPGVLP
jgi:Flp pilus assembly protein TadB